MKKITLLLTILLHGVLLLAQISPVAGRLKISIENVKCINKSWDGVVEFDGHGNEVSVTYSYRIYSPSNPGGARKDADGTVIYGSNVNGMTRAGTQTPDLGGINNGDVVNIFKPIMDEHINADEYIIIAPNVWEWDGPEKNTINAFNAQLERDLDFLITQPFPFANAPVSYNDITTPIASRVIKVFDKYRNYGPALKYQNIFSPILCNGNIQGNRVMGLVSGGTGVTCQVAFPPALLVLDTKALYGLYINNYNSTITGTSHAEKESKTNRVDGVTVTFTERTYAIETSNGSYSVFLRIEFTPDAPATSADGLTGTPTKNVPTAKKTLPGDRNINILNTALYIPGTWTGTFGYGEKNNTNFYSITFNADGTMQVIDNVGVIQARGTYTFTQFNRSITATYNYLSGDHFDFTGTLNDNVINADWWKNNDKNYKGKMVLYKK